MCDSCGCHNHGHEADKDAEKRVVEVHESLLAANNRQADENRRHMEAMGAVAINMISSPGSGKTTLLEHTVAALGGSLRMGVIEGDIETERDAERIRKKGVPVVQITTGGACHLDAPLVHKGLHGLEHQAMEAGLKGFDLIFIENVGNLVCPATFYLGEHQRIVLVSVPEGSDKPAKYPFTFKGAHTFVITKTDLLPHFDFSMEEVRKEALEINPELRILEVSAVTGQGMDDWIDYLKGLVTVE